MQQSFEEKLIHAFSTSSGEFTSIYVEAITSGELVKYIQNSSSTIPKVAISENNAKGFKWYTNAVLPLTNFPKTLFLEVLDHYLDCVTSPSIGEDLKLWMENLSSKDREDALTTVALWKITRRDYSGTLRILDFVCTPDLYTNVFLAVLKTGDAKFFELVYHWKGGLSLNNFSASELLDGLCSHEVGQWVGNKFINSHFIWKRLHDKCSFLAPSFTTYLKFGSPTQKHSELLKELGITVPCEASSQGTRTWDGNCGVGVNAVHKN